MIGLELEKLEREAGLAGPSRAALSERPHPGACGDPGPSVQPEVTLRLSVWLNRWPPPYTFLTLQRGPESSPGSPQPLSRTSLPGEGGSRLLGQARCEHQFHPACGQQGRGCEPPVCRRGSDGGACALSCETDPGAEPRFHRPPALLATETLRPHNSKSLRVCVSGRSSAGVLRRRGPGPSPVLGAGGLTQHESTSTPGDWLGDARLVRANPGLLPGPWRTGALLLLRLPGRQDASLQPWGHLSHPTGRDPPAGEATPEGSGAKAQRD